MSDYQALPDCVGGSVHDPCIKDALVRLVQKVTSDVTLREDLMQEAMVHFWQMEARRPGQTRSWYMQSCRFHLQHYLASGRSVDSVKRRQGRLPFAYETEDGEGIPEQSDAGNSVLTSVNARELMSLLSDHLQPQEKAVLECLAEGRGLREIGRELQMSHTMVIRHRRKIAALLNKLEALPAEPGENTQRFYAALSKKAHANGHSLALAGVNGHGE